MRLMQPLDPPGHYDSSDPFGNTAGRSYPHTGSDFNGVEAGTLAHAIGTGNVVNKQFDSGNGNTVTVALPDGHFYAYLHLQVPALVAVGDQVTIGQYIGKVGNTGTNSQGAHLHITVSDSASAYIGLGNKIDPWQFIQAHINDNDNTGGPFMALSDAQQADLLFKTQAIYDAMFAVTPTSLGSSAGVLKSIAGLEQKAGVQYDVAFKTTPVTLGDGTVLPGGILKSLKAANS